MATPWTEGRKRSFIVSVLRAGSRRWPPKYNTLNSAKTEKKKNVKTGRLAQHYKCTQCKKEYTSKDIQVDHIAPVVDPQVGFVSWDVFIERLFCDETNLQVLCTTCHNKKTKKEQQWKSAKSSKPPKAPSTSKASSRKKKPTT